jgi:ABC-type glycerol-3-phosphate transport system substrate-binding protein
MDERMNDFERSGASKLSRRGLLRAGLVGSVAVAGLAALAGCGEDEAAAPAATAAPAQAATKAAATAATAAPAQQEAVTIGLWIVNQNDDTKKVHEETIYPAFEAANPSIKIEHRWLTWSKNIETIITAFAGGSPPDIFELGASHSVTFSDRGQLFNIDPWLAAWDGTSDFFPQGLQTPFWNGHMWGLPHLIAPRTVFWRQDIFDEVGIQDVPVTWEDVVEATGKMTKVEDGQLIREGMNWVGIQEFHAMYMSISSTPPIIGGKSTINSPDGRATLQYLVDRWEATGGQAGGVELPESPIPYFVTGQQAAVYTNMGGSVRQVKRHKPELLDSIIVETPPVPGGDMYNASVPGNVQPVVQSFNDWMAVSAFIKNEDQTWELLQHLMSPENLLLYNETLFFIPPRMSAANQGFVLRDHNPKMVGLLNKYGVTASKMPSQRAFYKAGQDQFQEARFRKVSVEEAMQIAAADQDLVLEEADFTGGIYPDDDIRKVPVSFG